MKAPNGYGGIVNLGKGRRKPWAVRIPIGYTERGSVKYKYIGYYEKKADAFKARDEYNKRETGELISFGDVVAKWQSAHFPTISDATKATYTSQLKHMTRLFDADASAVTFSDLQTTIDSIETASAQKGVQTVLRQVYKYGLKYGYFKANLADGLTTKKTVKSTKHFKYDPDDVAVLWEHTGEDIADFVLVTIYTGMRPGELRDMTADDVDLDAHIMHVRQGKTENAVRNIPIHDAVYPIVSDRCKGGRLFPTIGNTGAWVRDYFTPELERLGVCWYTHPATGVRQKHLPHDGRHTFASQWKKQNLDESMRRYIQGHSGRGMGEQVYIHYDDADLLAEVNKLKYTSNIQSVS